MTSALRHVTVNGDKYTCVNKDEPTQICRDSTDSGYMVIADEDYMYMDNATDKKAPIYCNTKPGDNVNSPVKGCQDEPVYSLAGPIDDDLVVVENDLYGT